MVLVIPNMSPQYGSGFETLLRCGESLLMTNSSSSETQTHPASAGDRRRYSSTSEPNRPVRLNRPLTPDSTDSSRDGSSAAPATPAVVSASPSPATTATTTTATTATTAAAVNVAPVRGEASHHSQTIPAAVPSHNEDAPRPVRKQSLSYILNGASQDQQQMRDALDASDGNNGGVARGSRFAAVLSTSTTTGGNVPPGQIVRKRSAAQAGIAPHEDSYLSPSFGMSASSTPYGSGKQARVQQHGVLYGQEFERETTSSTSEGSDRKRRRRRASVPCELCGRVFGEAAALRKHKRVVHEKKKDFTCEDCGRAFAEKSNLKKHAQARHGAAAKPHPCPDCGKVFSFSDGLRRHINNCHLGLRPYSCRINGCEHSFKQRTHLQKHQQSVHGITTPAPTAQQG